MARSNKRGAPKSKDDYRKQWDSALKRPLHKSDDAASMKMPEFVRSLNVMIEATGDPVFIDAAAALKAYGFDIGLRRGSDYAFNLIHGDINHAYLKQIKHNVINLRWSVPEATHEVVARLRVSGQSFDAVVESLARAYREWARSGFPEQSTEPAGDLGYWLRVFPSGDGDLNLGTVIVPAEGLDVPANSFWRRLARAGSLKVMHIEGPAERDREK